MGMKALLNKAGFSKRSGTPGNIGWWYKQYIPFRRPFFFLIQLVVVLI
jgi:hypothetical protein